MCRNIKTLHNFKPPATEDEIRASSVQFVRKLSGFTRPSKANQLAFDRAVEQVTNAARELLASLVTNAPPRDRDVEAVKGEDKIGRPIPVPRREPRKLIDDPSRPEYYLVETASVRRDSVAPLPDRDRVADDGVEVFAHVVVARLVRLDAADLVGGPRHQRIVALMARIPAV